MGFIGSPGSLTRKDEDLPYFIQATLKFENGGELNINWDTLYGVPCLETNPIYLWEFADLAHGLRQVGLHDHASWMNNDETCF